MVQSVECRPQILKVQRFDLAEFKVTLCLDLKIKNRACKQCFISLATFLVFRFYWQKCSEILLSIIIFISRCLSTSPLVKFNQNLRKIICYIYILQYRKFEDWSKMNLSIFIQKKLLKDLTPDKKKRKYNYINSKYQTCRALHQLV